MNVDVLRSFAERIHTGTADPDSSRALIVFNLTGQSLDGVASFVADMSWPADTPLPPVVVRDMDGQSVDSAVTEVQESPDWKGRADWRRLTFTLRFAVRDVPPDGWHAYLAAYASEPVPDAALPDPTPGLAVVETLRHTGELPPTGTF